MRRFISCILGLIILYWSSAHANLLQNPSFDDGMAHWTMVYGSAQLTDWFRSGRYAVKLQDISRIQQVDIPVQSNTDYRLWMHACQRISGGYPNNVHFLMWVNDLLIYEETNGSIGAKWIGKSADFNTGSAETVSVSIACYHPDQGMTIDDIILVEKDTIPPVMLSAEACDDEAIVPGLDNDDYIVIAFSEPMNKAKLHYIYPDSSFGYAYNNIDSILILNNNHTWLNQNGKTGVIKWNENGDSLWIYFRRSFPWASVFPGDTITPDGITICDEWGNPVTNSVVITGSFGGEYGHIAGTISPNTFPPVPDSGGIKIVVMETGQSDTTTFGSGDYLIENIPVGEYTVIVSRFLFVPDTVQVAVVPDETTYVDISLNRFYIVPPFITDFEQDDGGFCGVVSYGWGELNWENYAHAHSGAKVWWTYTRGRPCNSFLYVPTVDLSSVSSAMLKFYHIFRVNEGIRETSVEASLDGYTWDSLFSSTEYESDWRADSVDLGAYIGDTIFVRFNIWGFCFDHWWNMDDFSVLPVGFSPGVEINDNEYNNKFSLSQNTPNPVNRTATRISYAIPKKAEVSLKIYDVSGRLVRTLVNGHQEPGFYSTMWDSKDSSGKKVAAGVYFYYLEADNYAKTRKLVLVR